MHRLATLAALAAALGACGTAPPRVAPPANTAELPIASDNVARTLLVDVRSLDSTIIVEARYATPDNFTGAPLPGYEARRALLRREAALALARVQRRLIRRHLSLDIFDGYRPVRATVAMVAWTAQVHREDLLRDGYIASRSRHNLGLAVDLTIVDLRTGRALEMGTPFDTFSPAAHTANATGVVARHRQELQAVMESEGFVNYDQEWWHYSFDVPNPLRFDLVIQ